MLVHGGLLLVLLSFCTADKCSSEEKNQLKEDHKSCTNTVQQRFSFLSVETENYREAKIIGAPMALKTDGGPTGSGGLEKEYVCKMIEETVRGCARIYQHCFDAQEMRQVTNPVSRLFFVFCRP